MSYAILELRLEEPAASLERQGDQWRARCERCGGHSKGFLRISHALAAQHRHGQVHVTREADDLTDLLDTIRRPLGVRPQVARTMSPPSRPLVPTRSRSTRTAVAANRCDTTEKGGPVVHHAVMDGAA